MKMRKVKGTLIMEGDKYLLEVGGEREELPVGFLADPAELKGMVART